MARNTIFITASPDEVFDVLEDAVAYPSWVVGARTIHRVDPTWPAAGSGFDHSVGIGPFGLRNSSSIVETERPRRIVIRAGIPIIGRALIEIEVNPTPGGSLVEMRESLEASAPVRLVAETPFHLRNAEALRRLKSTVEARGSLDGVLRGLGALKPAPPWLEEPPYRAVWSETELCYLAVETDSGPHVTPSVFTCAGGRLWIAVARDALKAKAVRKRGAAGVLVRNGDRSMLVSGPSIVIDPLRPWDVARSANGPLLLPAATVSYLRSNLGRILGRLAAGPGRLKDLLPHNRVVMCVSPQRSAVSSGSGLDHLHGGWPRAPLIDSPVSPDPSSGSLDEVPDDLAAPLKAGRTTAVLGWKAPFGPVALPAHWHGSPHLISVPSDLIALAGVTGRAPACLVLDEDQPGDLGEQKGLMIRGEAQVFPRGDYSAIRIEAGRATYWRGADSVTVGTAGVPGDAIEGRAEGTASEEEVDRGRPSRGQGTEREG